MDYPNQTFVNRFILLGLSDIQYLQVLYVLIFSIIYVITVLGNTLLIIAVLINVHLQTSMYFFLTNLSIIDICCSSTVVPKMLVNTLSLDKSVSLVECALQMFLSLVLGATQCIILTIMAYDRFVAICKPLHYNTVMNRRVCIFLAVFCWTVGFINSSIHVVFTFQLPFCRSHHIDHYFCEIPPFLQLSCRDTWYNEVLVYISACLIVVCSFFLTLTSYVYIISTILQIHSTKGRQKTFSTCASHLTVVCIYYGTIMAMYLGPHSAYSPQRSKIASIIYTSVTPMLNPIIYSVRNYDIRQTITKKLIRKYN
ncbi:olfactory receptor 5V1 [Xenopus laevis]|uniref:G-protein coupled receptors family 1 profile domain-containing protein n=2 Tax=Xenopus laevis TaxID=8355 RepID=A0A974H8T7_XENLA|nr:olfactory receptor 5V1 [Xenopus laevis]OCT69122.1 hypothetical protein XELAEV_18040431mg [Xenopus laevis]